MVGMCLRGRKGGGEGSGCRDRTQRDGKHIS